MKNVSTGNWITIGIVFASMVTFSLMNFYRERRVARETVEEEDKKFPDSRGIIAGPYHSYKTPVGIPMERS